MKVTYTLYTPYTDLAVKYKPKVDVFDRGIDGSYNPTEILRAMHRLQVSGRSIVTRPRLVCKAGARQEVEEKIRPSQKLLLRFFFLITIVQVATCQVPGGTFEGFPAHCDWLSDLDRSCCLQTAKDDGRGSKWRRSSRRCSHVGTLTLVHLKVLL